MDTTEQPIQVVQKAATVEEIIADHINGLGGYAIAEKYGLETDKVKQIINEADQRLAFVPAGVEAPVDALPEAVVKPLAEGENPEVGSVKGHK